MTDAKHLSSMSVSQLHSALVTLDIDLWSKASEQEMVATYERCNGYKSPIFRIVRSAWFLFAFSYLVVYLWWLGHQGRFSITKGVGQAIAFGIMGLLMSAPLAGILRLLTDWLSEVSGLDRAAWVARQLTPLSIHSSAMARVNNLVDTCHECAAYQRQLTIRGRTLRLVDFGAMVYLSNRAMAVRRP